MTQPHHRSNRRPKYRTTYTKVSAYLFFPIVTVSPYLGGVSPIVGQFKLKCHIEAEAVFPESKHLKSQSKSVHIFGLSSLSLLSR